MRYLGLFVLLCACSGNPVEKETPANDSTKKAIQYSTLVFRNSDGSFGYDVLQDSQLLIRQITIPAKSGTSGFKDSLKALQVADIAVSKINAGVFPPTIQATEIDSILK